jgi:hypothetical protein
MFGNMIVQEKPTRTGCFGNKSGIVAKSTTNYWQQKITRGWNNRSMVGNTIVVSTIVIL